MRLGAPRSSSSSCGGTPEEGAVSPSPRRVRRWTYFDTQRNIRARMHVHAEREMQRERRGSITEVQRGRRRADSWRDDLKAPAVSQGDQQGNQSVSQSVRLQTNQFVRLLGNQTVGIRSVNQSVNQETSQTVRKPVGQSASQESAQSESQSVSQSV